MEVFYNGSRYKIEINEKGQQVLHMWFSGITDISKIKGLNQVKDLEILYLNHNKIEEIRGLESLVNLKELHLHNNRITEIKGLETLKNLNELVLSRNRIKEIDRLDGLKNLKILRLSGNDINDIRGLDNLENLEVLDLSVNKITEIKGLNNLSKLKELILNHNFIYAIRGTEQLTSLSRVSFGMNPIWKKANKLFGGEKYRYGYLDDITGFLEYSNKGGDSYQEEENYRNLYKKRVRVYTFLFIIGTFIMSLGPFLLHYSQTENVFGWIVIILGIIMTLTFRNLSESDMNIKRKHKIVKIFSGLIGISLLILGIIRIVSIGYEYGIYFLHTGTLWMVFCTGLFGSIIMRSGYRM